MSTNTEESDEVFTRKWFLKGTLCLVALFLLFALFGYPGNGGIAVMCAGIITTAVRSRWDLRGYQWFWVTVALFIVPHIVLTLFVTWTAVHYPAMALLPFGVADFAIMYGCINLAEKRMRKSE